ncbi:MAG: SPFH domain-containing protein [Phycisphaerales bacterium]
MNRPIAIGVGILLFAAFLLFSSTYTVKYNEVALKATFGELTDDSVVREPGLHFRLPVFIDRVTKLDTRLQVIESPLEEVITADGQQIVARGFLFWRVDTENQGPMDFFDAYESVEGARASLAPQFRTALTSGLGGFAFGDLLGEGSDLEAAEERVRAALESQVQANGVQPVMVGISQLMLPARTARVVVDRMKTQRETLADVENRAGQAAASSVVAKANTDADKINSFAQRRASEIEAEATAYAESLITDMAEDQELAIFLAWLETLEASLSQRTTLILPTQGQAPWHLMNAPGSQARESIIPRPQGSGSAGEAGD